MSIIELLFATLFAVLASGQTLRKYNNRGCQGSLAVCSVRTDVGRSENWPQASCCTQGVKKSGSLRISGVQGSVGEISIVYRGNFNTQCSVQDSVYIGSPIGCVTSRALGTGAWLSCARQYANSQFNTNCSNYRKRRSIGNATAVEDPDDNQTEKMEESDEDTESDGDTDMSVTRPEDPDYLPPGFYDAFERPITEDEYWKQVEWEDEHNAPFIPDNVPLEIRQDEGPGLSITTYTGGQCRSARLRTITESDTCYASGNGASFFVEALPSNCKVITYTNTQCSEGSFIVIQSVRGVGALGCYDTDSFEGIAVTCG